MVGIAATPDGTGYWLVGSGGGVFAYGDARFHGSGVGAAPVPVIGLLPTPAGTAYTLVWSSGAAASFSRP